jgi:ABC-type nitrate/sulfonate/bicarbonate transport system permease component
VLINSDAQVFQFEAAWAGILVASLLGVALYTAVVAAERVVLRWSPSGQGS